MNPGPAIFGLLAVALGGCATFNAPERVGQVVQSHPNREGVYLAYYKYLQMIDDYGPGVEEVREAVRKEQSIDNKLKIWDRELAVAVPKYLEAMNLIPAACVNGIVVISSRGHEAGGGITAFRCK